MIFTKALPPSPPQSYFPSISAYKFFPDCLRSEAKERPINFFSYRLNPHYFQSLPLQNNLFLYLKNITDITLHLKSSYSLEISLKTEISHPNHCDISSNKKSKWVLAKPLSVPPTPSLLKWRVDYRNDKHKACFSCRNNTGKIYNFSIFKFRNSMYEIFNCTTHV